MPRRALQALERDLEHQPPVRPMRHLAHRAEALDGVVAHEAVDPLNILSSLQRLIRDVWNMGFDAVRWLWQYFLLGAVIVIPIWLIMRLLNAPKGR